MNVKLFDSHVTEAYVSETPRKVPGLDALHRMTALLLAERVPEDARILVLGAGGGLELKALAAAHAGWTFDGIDPSSNMLKLADRTVEPYSERIRLHQGYIRDAPEEAFDAATAFLTFHFIPLEERLPTLEEIHRRLKPGAPFVLAHISFPQTEPERSTWFRRHVAYGAPADADAAKLEEMAQAMLEALTVLPPETEEAMLREAGFTDVSLFYAALSFKGWIAYAGSGSGR